VTGSIFSTYAEHLRRPAGVLRRSYRGGGRRDEAFTQNLVWHRSSQLVAAERGALENEFVVITPAEADRITDLGSTLEHRITAAKGPPQREEKFR